MERDEEDSRGEQAGERAAAGEAIVPEVVTGRAQDLGETDDPPDLDDDKAEEGSEAIRSGSALQQYLLTVRAEVANGKSHYEGTKFKVFIDGQSYRDNVMKSGGWIHPPSPSLDETLSPDPYCYPRVYLWDLASLGLDGRCPACKTVMVRSGFTLGRRVVDMNDCYYIITNRLK